MNAVFRMNLRYLSHYPPTPTKPVTHTHACWLYHSAPSNGCVTRGADGWPFWCLFLDCDCSEVCLLLRSHLGSVCSKIVFCMKIYAPIILHDSKIDSDCVIRFFLLSGPVPGRWSLPKAMGSATQGNLASLLVSFSFYAMAGQTSSLNFCLLASPHLSLSQIRQIRASISQPRGI